MKMKFHLHHTEKLEGDVVSFVFEAPADFTWLPGQYMHYKLPHDNPDDRGDERWFTIAAPPFEKMPRITTRISEKASSFKRALAALKEGDAIETEGPEGDFLVDEDGEEHIFIAGGIGFTPFHAMLTQLNHEKRMPKITVLYGVRDDDPVYRSELDELSAASENPMVDYVVEPRRIDEELIKSAAPEINRPHFYVSGPEPMVEAFEEMLKKMGVEESKLHTDFFPGYTSI